MKYFYVITSSNISDVEELNANNMNKRKIGNNSWAIQVWSSEKKAYDFIGKYFRNLNLKPFRVEKSVLQNIMMTENIGSKVELDAKKP